MAKPRSPNRRGPVDRRDLIRRLEADGATVRLRRNGHYVAVSSVTGRKLFFAATPSDHRAYANVWQTWRHDVNVEK